MHVPEVLIDVEGVGSPRGEVSCLTLVLGTEFRSFVRAVQAFNHCVSSLHTWCLVIKTQRGGSCPQPGP